jgi:hypothetical protein
MASAKEPIGREPTPHCPHCGAEVQTPGGECWLCRLKEPPAKPNPYAPPRPTGENAGAQFSLASLFLVMTLVAVCLGVFMLAPGLGILFAIVATPALVRTTFTASYYKQAGAPLSPAWRIRAFVVSLFIMLAVGVTTFVTFQGVCWTGALLTQGRNPWPNVIVGVIVGLLVAIPVMIWMLVWSWPSKEAIYLDHKLRRNTPSDP